MSAVVSAFSRQSGLRRIEKTLYRSARRAILATTLASAALFGSTSPSLAATQTLKLYFVHTGEKASITFKRDGTYDPKGLAQINRFLRDWRKNEPTKMDTELLDLVWEVYRRTGSREYIHVVSGYRSADTNSMLRSRSANTGVARRSQHMLGKAMDFYIPGVSLATLRGIGMQMQVGGVGFYPTSGSPFVHLDVGNVRAWPRMSRQELAKIFPDGKTLHLPADGRPLPGYSQAVADARRNPGPAIISSREVDEEPTVSDSGKSLMTAMLPIPKTRAQAMIEKQLNLNAAIDTELSLSVVPLPIARPLARMVEDEDETLPIEPPSMHIVNLDRAVPRVLFTRPLLSIASLPMQGSSSGEASAFRGHRAQQRLRPTDLAFNSQMNGFTYISSDEAPGSALSEKTPIAAEVPEFDHGRFWSDG